MSPTHIGQLSYCTINALDHEGEDLLAKIKQAKVHSFIDQACAGGGKVLVHCFVRFDRQLLLTNESPLLLAENCAAPDLTSEANLTNTCWLCTAALYCRRE